MYLNRTSFVSDLLRAPQLSVLLWSFNGGGSLKQYELATFNKYGHHILKFVKCVKTIKKISMLRFVPEPAGEEDSL